MGSCYIWTLFMAPVKAAPRLNMLQKKKEKYLSRAKRGEGTAAWKSLQLFPWKNMLPGRLCCLCTADLLLFLCTLCLTVQCISLETSVLEREEGGCAFSICLFPGDLLTYACDLSACADIQRRFLYSLERKREKEGG